jgi:hypothetical protein
MMDMGWAFSNFSMQEQYLLVSTERCYVNKTSERLPSDPVNVLTCWDSGFQPSNLRQLIRIYRFGLWLRGTARIERLRTLVSGGLSQKSKQTASPAIVSRPSYGYTVFVRTCCCNILVLNHLRKAWSVDCTQHRRK